MQKAHLATTTKSHTKEEKKKKTVKINNEYVLLVLYRNQQPNFMRFLMVNIANSYLFGKQLPRKLYIALFSIERQEIICGGRNALRFLAFFKKKRTRLDLDFKTLLDLHI